MSAIIPTNQVNHCNQLSKHIHALCVDRSHTTTVETNTRQIIISLNSGVPKMSQEGSHS